MHDIHEAHPDYRPHESGLLIGLGTYAEHRRDLMDSNSLKDSCQGTPVILCSLSDSKDRRMYWSSVGSIKSSFYLMHANPFPI